MTPEELRELDAALDDLNMSYGSIGRLEEKDPMRRAIDRLLNARSLIEDFVTEAESIGDLQIGSWQPIDLTASQYDEPAQPPRMSGLLYDAERHLISGAPETAKTLLCLAIGAEEISQGGVLALIDFEAGARRTRRMLHDLGLTVEQIRRGVVY